MELNIRSAERYGAMTGVMTRATILLTLLLSHLSAMGILVGAPETMAYALLLLVSFLLRASGAFPLVLLFTLMHAYGLTAPAWMSGIPSLNFLVPFLLSTALIAGTSTENFGLGWLRRGEIDRTSWILVGITGLLSTAALLLWAFWTQRIGAGEAMVAGVPREPVWLVFGVGLTSFAFINAIAEEAVYRGVFQEAAMRAFKSAPVALALQASGFAAAHFAAGFPNGSVGYLMTFVYALMLGYLRIRTRGILAPWIAHVIADLCIGAFLLLHR